MIKTNFSFCAFFILAFLCTTAVFADNAPPHIDPALCQALVKHVPRADVTYQPGVDVDGKAVAPADLPGGSQIALPRQITIPITVQLTKLLNLNPNSYPASALGEGTEGVLGVITVDGDNILFNGKSLSDEQQNNLSVLCLKQK